MSKRCTYCGSENDETFELCGHCGTDLSSDEPPLPSAPPPLLQTVSPSPLLGSTLNARSATLIFLVHLGAQFAIAFIVGFIAATTLGMLRGLQDADTHQKILMIAALPMVLGGGLAMILFSIQRVGPHLRDRTPTGAAWVAGSPRQLLQGLGIGILVAIGYALLAILFPPSADLPRSALARMAGTPGLGQIVWLSIVLLLAPPIEELLFRGVVYAGYRNSFGPVWAAILSTFLFWVLHLAEIIHFWPAMVGILALALAALWFRLRCAAVGPAIALHLGYNAVIGFAAIIASIVREH